MFFQNKMEKKREADALNSKLKLEKTKVQVVKVEVWLYRHA